MPLRITIQFLPGGRADRAEVIASGIITNDGTGDFYNGNYRWLLQRKTSRSAREGRVTGFKRRSRGPWELLWLVLQEYRRMRVET